MHRIAAAAAALSLAACASAPGAEPSAAPEPPAQRQPVEAGEITEMARLLRLEDRREFDSTRLAIATRHPSPRVRERAALYGGRLLRREAGPLLEGLLDDANADVAAAAAFALGQLGDTSAVARLARELEPAAIAARPAVAAEAAYALGKLRSTGSRRALRRLLAESAVDDGETAGVVASALLAIWRFPRADGDPIARWLGSRDSELRWRAVYALVRRPDPAAVPALLERLEDPDPRARALALRGLSAPLADSSGLGADAALPHVLERLDDPADPVRIAAISALGSYRTDAAIAALVERLGGGGPHARLAAESALGAAGEAAAAAAPPLLATARDTAEPGALRENAIRALARIRPDLALAAAEPAAADPDPRVRAVAAEVRAAASAPGWERALDDDPMVAVAAVAARLSVRGDTLAARLPEALDAVGAEDVIVRATGLSALGRLQDPSTLPVLLDAFGRAAADPANDAALAALGALGRLRDVGADPASALFARFGRPGDPLVHARALELFGDAAREVWGDPTPIETGLDLDGYGAIVRGWIAPVLQGACPIARIHTESGEIVVELFPEEAPLTVRSFAALADAGFFDGQRWPRVVPNFVVQGGDPRGDTNGGPGYTIRDELNPYRYGTGTLGMALSGPDTGGSQFFITHFPQPHLDGIYTVFGKVVEGQAVAERILPGERIDNIRVEWRDQL